MENGFDWEMIAKVVAIPAFILSVWNTVSPYLWITHELINENQIQLAEYPSGIAFNILFVITASGPGRKLSALKMEKAYVTLPNASRVSFNCMSILKEEGTGQANKSRNILFDIRGGEGKVLTFAFQSQELLHWVSGEYAITFDMKDSNGNAIKISSIYFEIDSNVLNDLARPNSTRSVLVRTKL